MNIFYADPLNISVGDFSIWLLGFKIEFSCLYKFHKDIIL